MFFNIAKLSIRGEFGYFVVQKPIKRLSVEFGVCIGLERLHYLGNSVLRLVARLKVMGRLFSLII